MGLPARGEGLTIWMMAAAWIILWSINCHDEIFLAKVCKLKITHLRGWILLLCFLLAPNFIALIKDLKRAPRFALEQQGRINLINERKNKGYADVIIPFLNVRPKLLYYSDIQSSPMDWKNQSFAEYWKLKTVRTFSDALVEDRQMSNEEFVGNLTELAQSGNTEAQFALAELYDTTFAPYPDLEKNDILAAKWYEAAAVHSHSHAQRRLTRLYALGKGVPKSLTRALIWYVRSQL